MILIFSQALSTFSFSIISILQNWLGNFINFTRKQVLYVWSNSAADTRAKHVSHMFSEHTL